MYTYNFDYPSSFFMSYPNRLSSDTWDGNIGQIRVRWSKAGSQRLIEFVSIESEGHLQRAVVAATGFATSSCARVEGSET